MANPWFRLYAEFATDPKVQRLSETDQRRYIMLLCVRCSNGDVTLHDDDVAFQLRISDEDWAATKDTLIKRNLIGDDNLPVAWEKRQYVSDSSASRVSKHRNKKKQAGNGDVTLQKRKSNGTDTDTDTDTDKHTTSSGEAFAMHIDWRPSEEFPTLAKMAMVEVPQEIGEFVAYWKSQAQVVRTQSEWDHALIKNLINAKLRAAAIPSAAGKQTKFDPVDFVNNGRGAGDENVIDIH